LEQINGYEILKSTVFANSRGFALGHNSKAPSPYVTWQFTEGKNGQRDYYWGHYGNSREWAEKDFTRRVEDYKDLQQMTIRSISEQPKECYLYYSTQRPIDLGTFPKPAGNPPLEIINYDDDRRRPVAGGNIEAWGELTYAKPLTEKQMQDPNWYTNFDFIDVWDIDSNSGIPYPQLKRNPQVRLKEMKIKHNPVKVEYNQGDQISLQGGDVELQYENGKTALVSMDETMLGHYDMMKIGKQTIEVKRLNKTASFTINVNPIPVKQITLDKTQLVLKKGETATLTATISPENATNKDVEWSSQNSSIARIDQNGKITAVSPGNTVIEAKSESTGTVIATCNLSVIVTCDSLSITNKTVWDDDAGEYCITLNHGNTLQLKCDVSPSDATEGITWQSQNVMVAIVNAQGGVTAVGTGMTEITARSESGEMDSIYIYVPGTTPTPAPAPAPTVPNQEETEPDTTYDDSSYTHNAKQSKKPVRPGNTRVKKLKSIKKRLWVQWSKAKNAKYYQVIVATNKSFTKGLKGGKLTGLRGWCKIKRKKTYYVRVRAISSTGLVGKWSKAKKIKCK